MTHITVDATLASQLQQLSSVAELRDPTGRIVARVVPIIDWSQWRPLSPDVSDEELDRREQSNEKRYTTAEVLAHLEKL